jgi:hypothetical protein
LILFVFAGLAFSVTGQKRDEKAVKVSGRLVAYDLGRAGINQTEGLCGQRLVLRSGNRAFYLVLHIADCSAMFSESFLLQKRKWNVRLVRKPTCDASFDELDSVLNVSPDGIEKSFGAMKRTPAASRLQFPTSPIPCYEPAASSELSLRPESMPPLSVSQSPQLVE